MPDRNQAKPAKVRLGIDVLAAGGFAQLAGLRIGLLANDASRDSSGRRTVQVLAKAPGVQPRCPVQPGARDRRRPGWRDRVRARFRNGPAVIHSLYGSSAGRPPKMLAGLDAVVVDLQDVGVRFYTYATTMGYLMEAAAQAPPQGLHPGPAQSHRCRRRARAVARCRPAFVHRLFSDAPAARHDAGRTCDDVQRRDGNRCQPCCGRDARLQPGLLVRRDRAAVGQSVSQSPLGERCRCLSWRCPHRRRPT